MNENTKTDVNDFNNRLNILENSVSEIYSLLFPIHSPKKFTLNNSHLTNSDLILNQVNSNYRSDFKIEILKILDNELNERFKRKNQVIILGLKRTDDYKSLNIIFKSLNQPIPLKFNRLTTTNRENNYPNPLICDLKNEHHVENLLICAHKLKYIGDFENVYINKNLTKSQRIQNSIARKIRKKTNNFKNYKEISEENPTGNQNLDSVSSQVGSKLSKATTSMANLNPNVSQTSLNLSQSTTVKTKPINYSLKVYSSQELNVTNYLNLICKSATSSKFATFDSLLIKLVTI
ncbi:unnamed protein product [Brachionus calyciflorus]|uniref:Uncharacterized protein n=1 Tax=Brachionus calyciflorus TaxID=104777 RepID=A0A813SXI6_9BILA|nr:unnamed protein product [Brachionus calyciflorus]